jgi:Gene product 88
MIRLSTNNGKLVKTSGETYKVIGFGIPADHTFGAGMNTCPSALACRAVCFAKQGTYNFPAVKAARMANLDASMGASFVADTIAALRRKRSYNVVRIHDSGDFYSQAYYDAWCEIARAMPDKVFYAYTKSMHLDLWGGKPDNFRLVQSLGGKHDKRVDLSKPHSRIFASHAAREAAGYVDGNVSDLPAIEGEIRIGLVYHGGRNLTPAQERYFG